MQPEHAAKPARQVKRSSTDSKKAQHRKHARGLKDQKRKKNRVARR
jgi:hypothetical protein